MKIDKKKLALLQGLNPCTKTVTFVPPAYDVYKDDESMEGLLPSFTCDMLTNDQVRQVKEFMAKIANNGKLDKKTEMLSIIGGNIKGWSNMYDLSSGEEIEYTAELVGNQTENVIESIFVELSKYAGFIPR